MVAVASVAMVLSSVAGATRGRERVHSGAVKRGDGEPPWTLSVLPVPNSSCDEFLPGSYGYRHPGPSTVEDFE